MKRKPKITKKPRSDKQRANDLENEYYRGAIQEAYPKWQDVYKELYGRKRKWILKNLLPFYSLLVA